MRREVKRREVDEIQSAGVGVWRVRYSRAGQKGGGGLCVRRKGRAMRGNEGGMEHCSMVWSIAVRGTSTADTGEGHVSLEPGQVSRCVEMELTDDSFVIESGGLEVRWSDGRWAERRDDG